MAAARKQELHSKNKAWLNKTKKPKHRICLRAKTTDLDLVRTSSHSKSSDDTADDDDA
jgi:hypothetical protein